MSFLTYCQLNYDPSSSSIFYGRAHRDFRTNVPEIPPLDKKKKSRGKYRDPLMAKMQFEPGKQKFGRL